MDYRSTCLVDKQCKRLLNLFCSQSYNLNVAPCNAISPYGSTMLSISPYSSFVGGYPTGSGTCDCGYTQYYAGPVLGCGSLKYKKFYKNKFFPFNEFCLLK